MRWKKFENASVDETHLKGVCHILQKQLFESSASQADNATHFRVIHIVASTIVDVG